MFELELSNEIGSENFLDGIKKSDPAARQGR